jgi:hypothetical protein
MVLYRRLCLSRSKNLLFSFVCRKDKCHVLRGHVTYQEKDNFVAIPKIKLKKIFGVILYDLIRYETRIIAFGAVIAYFLRTGLYLPLIFSPNVLKIIGQPIESTECSSVTSAT